MSNKNYRGRLAPSPTGYLHLGHARTFWVAQQRVRANGGELILRNEDLDSARFKMEFVDAMLEDLRWFGFEWSEGPDIGGKFAPYNQSKRMNFYRAALEKLRAGNFIYPCTCSRKDILAATHAPHANDDDEPIYPGTCRGKNNSGSGVPPVSSNVGQKTETKGRDARATTFSWRFRIPDGETISFNDGNFGEQKYIAGKDFGDFVVWRGDDFPAYQLACVADDAAMEISEVVRGEDLLVSTARQILIYRALRLPPPKFFHCELMLDEKGERLAKRHDALSLRQLRELGETPESLRAKNNFLAFEARPNFNSRMNPKLYFLPLTAAACITLSTAAFAQTAPPTNAPARPARPPTLPGPPPGDTTIVSLPFTEDFESGKIDTNIWDFRVHGDATIKVTQDNVAHGKNALQVHYPTGARGAYAFLAVRLPEAVHDHLYGRAYVYIKWLPPGHMVLMNAGTRGFPISNFLEIGQSRGQFQPSFQLNGPGPDRGETTAREGQIPFGRWFCLEWEFNDKPDRIVEWVDGQQVVDKSFAYKGANSELVKGFAEYDFGFRAWGNANALTNDIDVYYDDIAISDKPIGQLTPVPSK